MMDWGSNGWGAGDWVAMSALMIVSWAALIALIVWVLRTNRSQAKVPADHAEALLSERFARGEIDGEQFTRSRELLHTGGASRSHSGR
jgi:putative membrane protein